MSHRVILIGPPGSGKTSIGKQVAKMTNSVFTDTDHEIETKVGKSITNIFLEDGESFFREREKEIVIGGAGDSSMTTAGSVARAALARRAPAAMPLIPAIASCPMSGIGVADCRSAPTSCPPCPSARTVPMPCFKRTPTSQRLIG